MRTRTQEQELRSAEERVSGLKRIEDRERLPDAKYVLGLFRRFLLEDWKKEKPARASGKGYPSRGTVTFDEKPKRAAMRVASEPLYRLYEDQLLLVYGSQSVMADTAFLMAQERCQEFVIQLQASLEKRPFVDHVGVDEAKDAFNALIPARTCAHCLGVSKTTLYRWLTEGLERTVQHGYPSSANQGSRVYVNFFAALEWKHTHHKPGKARTNPGKTRAKRKVA